MITTATDDTFEQLVLDNPRPVLVQFGATWAGPSVEMSAVVVQVADTYAHVLDVVYVDVDASPRVTKAFEIASVPTIAFFQPGRGPQGAIGLRSVEDLAASFGLDRLGVQRGVDRSNVDLLDEIRRLGELRDQGVLSEDEFGDLKRRLLDGHRVP